MTLAHAPMNYHVSQFGHSNQETADTYQLGTPITLHRDTLSKIAISSSDLLTMNEPLPFRSLNPIPVLEVATKAICRGKSLWV